MAVLKTVWSSEDVAELLKKKAISAKTLQSDLVLSNSGFKLLSSNGSNDPIIVTRLNLVNSNKPRNVSNLLDILLSRSGKPKQELALILGYSRSRFKRMHDPVYLVPQTDFNYINGLVEFNDVFQALMLSKGIT